MKEPIENVDGNTFLNMETHGKLHVLFGGTKVVQHTPPTKTTSGLRGIFYFYSFVALSLDCSMRVLFFFLFQLKIMDV